MNINEYKDKVIDLFRRGNPSEEQWEAMAIALLNFSEAELSRDTQIKRNAIDDVILGPEWDCSCGTESNREENCGCGLPRVTY